MFDMPRTAIQKVFVCCACLKPVDSAQLQLLLQSIAATCRDAYTTLLGHVQALRMILQSLFAGAALLAASGQAVGAKSLGTHARRMHHDHA